MIIMFQISIQKLINNYLIDFKQFGILNVTKKIDYIVYMPSQSKNQKILNSGEFNCPQNSGKLSFFAKQKKCQ